MLQHFTKLKSGPENSKILSLTEIVKVCRNAGSSPEARKSFEYAVERFVKGLQSQQPGTRLEYYSGLSTLLSLTQKVDANATLAIIEAAIGSGPGETKQERKMLKVAGLLSYGAFVRAKGQATKNKSWNVELAEGVLKPIVDIAVKKKNLQTLAAPFICFLVNSYPSTTFSDEFLNDLKRFLAKQESEEEMGLPCVKIILTAEEKGLSPSLGTVGVDDIIKALLAEGDASDDETLKLIFSYVKKQNLSEAFWEIFIPSLGPYHTQLFCSCISHSIKSGCPVNHVLTEAVVQLLLSIFFNKDLKDAKKKATTALESLVTWNDSCGLSHKERKRALKLLYTGKPNLLFEYQALQKVIKQHLQHLTTKELDYLAKLLLNPNKSDEIERGSVTTMDLLSLVANQKASSSDLSLQVFKSFFQTGFCKPVSAEVEATGKENLSLKQQHCVSHYLSGLQKKVDPSFVSEMYSYVGGILKGEDESHKLRKPLEEAVQSLWDDGKKLLKKSNDAIIDLVTQIGALQVMSGSDDIKQIFEGWINAARKSLKKGAPQETIIFIIDQVAAMEVPFFNIEAIFRRFTMEGKATEEIVQALADAIDVEEDFGDDSEDEDDSDDDDDDEDMEVAQNEKTNGFDNPNQHISFANAGSIMNGDSDSDATIDMDDATEEDLRKMDEALAGVFSAKRKVKDAARLESVRHMRVLSLVDTLIGRYKEPPISVVLILLMPLISSVKHNLSIKSNQNELQRTLTTLKRLNKFRKFSGMEDVDKDLLSTLAQEIRDLIKKKIGRRDIKDTLSKSITNLLGSDGSQGSGKQELSKEKGAKKKKNRTLNPTQAGSSAQSSNPTTPKGKEKTAETKPSKSLESSTEGPVLQVPAKRKHKGSEKKKAKLLRMQVLNDGLSNVE